MQLSNQQSKWKKWFTAGRLIPSMTILGAGIAIVLSFLGFIQFSIAEGIIIALVGLLAIDALNERLSILEEIGAKLNNISEGQALKKRRDIVSVEDQTAHASEICLAATAARTLFIRNYSFFANKLKNGCKFRIVLLNPNSPSIQTYLFLNDINTIESDIRSTLEHLTKLFQTSGGENLEVRLSDVFLPFAIFGGDLQRQSGSMIVEYLTYKMPDSDRPHILLTYEDSPHWFSFYSQEFEKVWSDASVWIP